MLNNRYDFKYVIEVTMSNPNGDPDADNMPRQMMDSGLGFISAESMKRKIRDYVAKVKGLPILIESDESLNAKNTKAYEALGLPLGAKGGGKDGRKNVKLARDYMCEKYYDARVFGAVMSTGDNPCGRVAGPVQIYDAISVSRIAPETVRLTRKARTTDERMETGDTEIGCKHIVPHAVYVAEGSISAAQADSTGMSEEDVEILFDAILHMFQDSHSAARGRVWLRKLVVFKHDNKLGKCQEYQLFDKVKVKQTNPEKTAVSWDDYTVEIDRDMPDGVEMIEML